MSVSLYYQATRPTPLTSDERNQVDVLVEQYTATSPHGEDGLIFYAETEETQILQGSTKMPEDLDSLEIILRHLFGALTTIRRTVSGAEWHVTLDDTDVDWDNQTGKAPEESDSGVLSATTATKPVVPWASRSRSRVERRALASRS